VRNVRQFAKLVVLGFATVFSVFFVIIPTRALFKLARWGVRSGRRA
jgi:hypothetical protein